MLQGSQDQAQRMASDTDMEAIEAVENAKEEVVTKLRFVEVAFLTEICVELNVTIPPKKAGIKSALINPPSTRITLLCVVTL